MKRRLIKIIVLILAVMTEVSAAQENVLLRINVKENYGLERELEYVELSCQLEAELFKNSNNSFFVQELSTGKTIDCQILSIKSDSVNNKILTRIIFPVSCGAHEKKEYLLKTKKAENVVSSDLTMSGHGTELVIENKYYRGI